MKLALEGLRDNDQRAAIGAQGLGIQYPLATGACTSKGTLSQNTYFAETLLFITTVAGWFSYQTPPST